ncbi:MAG: LytR cell envelope-related transcriptional attenuator [Gaiellaceae bacterium]|nr:LytR cell envelope-related transcriptional attenuator [Gaiellaceae bacterium]
MRPAKTGSLEHPRLELLEPVEATTGGSPLAGARARRQLTVEEAARRSGLTRDQVVWLESGRVYAFRTPEDALAATMLLCAALDVDMHTARELVGLPTMHRSLERNPRGRLSVVVALVVLTALVAGVSGYAWRSGGLPGTASTTLPPRATVAVPVFNGGSDYNYARRVANRVKALGYAVPSVTPAGNFNYAETAVYYSAGERRIAGRLAGELCVPLEQLPPGSRAHQVVVIAGPARLSNC